MNHQAIKASITKCLRQYSSADVFCIEQWCGFPEEFDVVFYELVKRGDVVKRRARRGRFGVGSRYALPLCAQ